MSIPDAAMRRKLMSSLGRHPPRRAQLSQAKAAFQEMREILPLEASLEAAQASYGLARVALGQGQLEEARRLGAEALAMLAEIGHVEAAEVRDWLTDLSIS